MKIYSLTTGVVGYSTRIWDSQHEQAVKEKGEKQDSGSQNQSNQEQPQDKPDGGLKSQEPVKAEDIENAIEAFQADQQTQANGLNASVIGTGPGLRVILKDESGSIVRKLTGEEFIRLRESSFRDSRIRGKILDQKL